MSRSLLKPAATLLLLLGAAGCSYTSQPAPMAAAPAPAAVMVTPAPSGTVVVPGTVVRTY